MCVGHERCSCHLDLHYQDDGLCPACGERLYKDGEYLQCDNDDCGWWCLTYEDCDEIGV